MNEVNKKSVFIGMYITILKRAHIGENSIIRACSVVPKNILTNEFWIFNSIKLIRKLNDG